MLIIKSTVVNAARKNLSFAPSFLKFPVWHILTRHLQ